MLLCWCKFGQDLIDVFFLDFFHQVPRALKVVFDFIVPHLFPVNVAVQNSTEPVVIVIIVSHFNFVFDLVEAFAHFSTNLVPRSVIVIWCE